MAKKKKTRHFDDGGKVGGSIYNPSGETTLGLNNSGISDDGHGYFINKEKEAEEMRRARDNDKSKAGSSAYKKGGTVHAGIPRRGKKK
jgi:hypothetical protein